MTHFIDRDVIFSHANDADDRSVVMHDVFTSFLFHYSFMINKKEVVPPKHKPPTDGPENKNRLKRKLQTVEAELAVAGTNPKKAGSTVCNGCCN